MVKMEKKGVMGAGGMTTEVCVGQNKQQDN